MSYRKSHSYAYVAFWQFMSFSVLLLAVWVNEIWDLSARIFGESARSPSLFNGCLLSAVVILVAIVTVGHTYSQQKRIIKGLLTVCSYCHRIKIDHEVWEHLDEYVLDHSDASFTHGICPECFEAVSATVPRRNTGQSAVPSA